MIEQLATSDKTTKKRDKTKMPDGDLGTRKTLFVLVIVVGCFAVLWPKVFYPMMVGPSNQRMKPTELDKGCCDVISDTDVNTIKIMSELCNSIIPPDQKSLASRQIITQCRAEVLNKCGIDISAVLQEQVRLGRSFKQIVDEVRSLNGSLCLKYNFGVSPWKLGVSHRVTINLSPAYIRQERPSHIRPEMLHPALREKGRAIAQPYQQPGKGSQPKFIDGRPGPVPGVRPPMGGGSHIVHPQQKGLNSMGVIMPIYTVGIVIFFSYTLMKLLFKKKPEGPGAGLYPPVEPSLTFRKEVFESQKARPQHGPGARDEELDHLRRRLRETELAMERIVAQMAQVPLRSQKEQASNGTVLPNGSAKHEHDQPSVKVLGMEMTASCEGGQKWSRPESPVIPCSPPPMPEPAEPPQEIFLEGALPAQSQLLVSDSTIETETNSGNSSSDPAVVLASKMTLSVISLDAPDHEYGCNKVKLHNGHNHDTELCTDEVFDESKYTTASGTTAAERDISEDEETDNEGDLEEEIENVPEYFVDNGVEKIEDLLSDDEVELQFNDKDDKQVDLMSADDIQTIGAVIDNVIAVGTRMSELISEEKKNESDEEVVEYEEIIEEEIEEVEEEDINDTREAKNDSSEEVEEDEDSDANGEII